MQYIRTISIPERLCKTLTEYRVQQNRHIAYLGDGWKNLDYIFTEEDGHVMYPHTPTKQFDHFLKRHGIRHLKFHGLRHPYVKHTTKIFSLRLKFFKRSRFLMLCEKLAELFYIFGKEQIVSLASSSIVKTAVQPLSVCMDIRCSPP